MKEPTTTSVSPPKNKYNCVNLFMLLFTATLAIKSNRLKIETF